MAKRVNCRHGLNSEQELQARKVSRKLIENDPATLKIYNDMFLEYIKECKGPYIEYVKCKDHVYYSALKRTIERKGAEETYNKIFSH